MIRTLALFALPFVVIAVTACEVPSKVGDLAYQQEIDTWHQSRIASLMAPDGWLALAGLFWLKDGRNTVGSHPDQAILFPAKAPDTLGTFWLTEDSVYMTTASGYQVQVNGQSVSSYNLSDRTTSPVAFYENLSWIFIKRSNKSGIRLWDQQHPKLADTIHIDRYPVAAKWRLRAEWIPDTSGHTVRIRNVLDMQMDLETEGRLRFEFADKVYELTALDGGEDELFLIFADDTSGDQTYSGGRYLYADRPNEADITFIDFNKAYNPPCAFTEFATCLLPPAENRLDLAITAGELNYGDH